MTPDCLRGLSRLFASYIKETENVKVGNRNASKEDVAEVAGTTFHFYDRQPRSLPLFLQRPDAWMLG
jgi:hypothetical protein